MIRKTNKKEIKKQFQKIDSQIKNGIFIFSGPMSILDFAKAVNKSSNAIITYFFQKGQMFNINHNLSEEQIGELCFEYNLDFKKEKVINIQNFMDDLKIEDKKEELENRPPIITVMGHVNHGKTTLIDFIRKSHIANKESGGITQHTGAYQVEYQNKKITFLDTPGHEAFTSMRSRGAQITDIVILVIAADDGVMPQTKEAIVHTKLAKVPMIIFVNKIDKPGIDLKKVENELLREDIISEDLGGDVQFVYGSAQNGKGIDNLFEIINLQAEMLELKANPNRLAMGVVVESQVDKGKGIMATLIVQNGTLLQRDFILAGSCFGKIKTMENDQKEFIKKAIPGMPVTITGLNNGPNPGDKFFVFKDEKYAKSLADQKTFFDKQKNLKSRNVITISKDQKQLNLIIKGDFQGTTEAVKQSLSKLTNEEIKIKIISASTGSITKSDVLLAQTTNANIYAFNIRPSDIIKKFAHNQNVEIFLYSIIYKMIEDVQKLIQGMKKPKFEEKIIGKAKIIKIFFYSKVGNIAGCILESGYIIQNALVRLIRDDRVIYEGVLDSLKKENNFVKKIENKVEFGCHIKNFNDIKEGDYVEAYDNFEVV